MILEMTKDDREAFIDELENAKDEVLAAYKDIQQNTDNKEKSYLVAEYHIKSVVYFAIKNSLVTNSITV